MNSMSSLFVGSLRSLDSVIHVTSPSPIQDALLRLALEREQNAYLLALFSADAPTGDARQAVA